jgi:hypothetical protein
MLNDITRPGITKTVCSQTIKILESITGFSIVDKDCIITPQTDSSFGTLAYHLCLVGESTIIVDEKTVFQKPGKIIIFNQEYTHSLYNHSGKDRIILYIDFKIN